MATSLLNRPYRSAVAPRVGRTNTAYYDLSPAGFIAQGGEVTNAFCNAVGEDDARCQQMKDLYTVLTGVVLAGAAVAVLAAIFSE